MRSFLDRYLPVFQAPDTPSGAAPSSPSAPASTPSTPDLSPTPPPDPGSDAASTAGADSSFGFMFDDANEDPLEGLGLPATKTPTPVTATPEPAPAQPAKPATASPEPAKPSPSPAPAPTEPTSPAPAPNLDPYDPGALARHLAENEEQAVQYAAENLFKLSPKDVEDLESDVVGTIPRLLGRALVASQRNFLLQLSQLVPTMIQRQGAVAQAHTQAEGEFFTRWPDIGKVKDAKVTIGDKQVAISDLVKQYAVVYRQMHPQASRSDAIEAVGPMVMMAAKIVPDVVPAVASQVRPSPMAPTNGRPPQPTPFVPAGPSAGGASPTNAPQLSAVEAMFAEPDS